MAADTLIDKKVTQEEADRMQAPMELDLTALFKVMESNMLVMTEEHEGQPEKLIDSIVNGLIGPTGGEIQR